MNGFDKLVHAAITFNQLERPGKARVYMSDAVYAYEFCTVRMSLGRQTGKTTFIANNAVESDLVIVRNDMNRDHLESLGCKAKLILTIDEVKYGHSVHGKMFKNIWVDEPISDFAWMSLYKLTANSRIF